MTKTETIKLIKGNFTPGDAKEILREIFSSKINFHNLKNWSSEERFGKPDLYSRQRVTELRADWKQVEKFIDEAESFNKNLSINAPIKIEMLDE